MKESDCFLLLPRTCDGIRDYGVKDLGWIAFIKCMRSAGLPIEALIEYVELFQQGDASTQARLDILKEQRTLLKKGCWKCRLP